MKENLNPDIIYRYGIQFSKVLDKIESGRNFSGKTDYEKCALLTETIVAELVNRAFAIELYLKALIVKEENSYGRCHKLDELFRLLNKNTQDIIKETFVRTFESFHNKDFEGEFENILKLNSNIFVEWRYAFEKTGRTVNYDFFQVLEITVRSCAIVIFEPEYAKEIEANMNK